MLDKLVGKIHAAILRAGGGYPRQVNVKPVRVKMGRIWHPTLKGMGSAQLRGLVPHSPQVSQPCDKDSPKTRARSNSVTSMRSDVGIFSLMNLPRPGKAWGPGIHGNWTYHQVLEGVSRFDTRYEADTSNPIRSLDQLYSQATLLRPSLQSLILHLASRHKGMLPKKVKIMPQKHKHDTTLFMSRQSVHLADSTRQRHACPPSRLKPLLLRPVTSGAEMRRRPLSTHGIRPKQPPRIDNTTINRGALGTIGECGILGHPM
jgi:hypothetical protein